ncbi:hypothetical protein K437DRAFT_177851 [Tilletiaria anomala UBC 951]|uniref:Uncharacterized protein n=1 Tax=Tilletiaria anomala (strain ATCC 24038 / CBS 436.72 / UBC 951) TaxID=1037660 RepID=A0A066VM19_TILAU|nr:uncharacterized protein K437DRAFT_177851 [Tilletiaria anomala UBC 951]KDN41313.1 hypothetical protein K437DRAFT_177851 [Tilletiaria anomala UBC 951]
MSFIGKNFIRCYQTLKSKEAPMLQVQSRRRRSATLVRLSSLVSLRNEAAIMCNGDTRCTSIASPFAGTTDTCECRIAAEPYIPRSLALSICQGTAGARHTLKTRVQALHHPCWRQGVCQSVDHFADRRDADVPESARDDQRSNVSVRVDEAAWQDGERGDELPPPQSRGVHRGAEHSYREAAVRRFAVLGA